MKLCFRNSARHLYPTKDCGRTQSICIVCPITIHYMYICIYTYFTWTQIDTILHLWWLNPMLTRQWIVSDNWCHVAKYFASKQVAVCVGWRSEKCWFACHESESSVALRSLNYYYNHWSGMSWLPLQGVYGYYDTAYGLWLLAPSPKWSAVTWIT